MTPVDLQSEVTALNKTHQRKIDDSIIERITCLTKALGMAITLGALTFAAVSLTETIEGDRPDPADDKAGRVKAPDAWNGPGKDWNAGEMLKSTGIPTSQISMDTIAGVGATGPPVSEEVIKMGAKLSESPEAVLEHIRQSKIHEERLKKLGLLP